MKINFQRFVKLPYHCIYFLILCIKAKHLSFKQKIHVYFKILILNLNVIFNNKQEDIAFSFLGMNIHSLGYLNLLLLIEEIFIKGTYDIDLQEDNPTIIDAGANIGVAMLFFKWKYKNAKILCFEPNENCLRYLYQNISSNELTNIEIYEAFLSNTTSEINIAFPTSNLTSLNAKEMLQNETSSDSIITKKVNTRQLSNFFNSKINLLKLDIEGGEVDVLYELIESKKFQLIENYIIEYHYSKTSKESLASFLNTFISSNFVMKNNSDVTFRNEKDIIVILEKKVK